MGRPNQKGKRKKLEFMEQVLVVTGLEDYKTEILYEQVS